MQRLSGLDASFLYLETNSQLLHVCALLTLDTSTVPGGYEYEKFHRQLAERVRAAPEFRRKLHDPALNVGHPVWVEDADFDLDHHVHRIGVPGDGARDDLAQLCAHVAGQPLNRERPLWEIYLIEGLADGSTAVLLKMHHSSVDGVSGANLLAHLASPDREVTPPEPAPSETGNEGVPGPFTLLRNNAAALARRPVELARLAPGLTALVPKWLSRSLNRQGMPVPFTAPRTSLNGTITGHRSVAFTQLELDDVKAIKNAFGVTVNDVVLAVCAGALRRFLAERDDLPGEPLVATVPVSVHDRSANEAGSNKVSAFFASLPTHQTDPVARVHAIAENNRVAKEHHYAIDADMLQDWAQFAAPAVFGLAVRAYSALRLAEKHRVVHNLLVSNVPGPPMPLYLLGARITGMYPLGPVLHGAGLNITVMSNADRVNVGIIAARETVPDPWSLADAFPEALAELTTTTQGAG